MFNQAVTTVGPGCLQIFSQRMLLHNWGLVPEKVKVMLEMIFKNLVTFLAAWRFGGQAIFGETPDPTLTDDISRYK